MQTQTFQIPSGTTKKTFGANGDFLKLVSCSMLPIQVKTAGPQGSETKTFNYQGEAIKFERPYNALTFISAAAGDNLTFDIGFGMVLPQGAYPSAAPGTTMYSTAFGSSSPLVLFYNPAITVPPYPNVPTAKIHIHDVTWGSGNISVSGNLPSGQHIVPLIYDSAFNLVAGGLIIQDGVYYVETAAMLALSFSQHGTGGGFLEVYYTTGAPWPWFVR